MWGFLPECQKSVNSLSNVMKIQLQDVTRRAEVSLFRGQPAEQKETVHTIKDTQKNSWKETHFWLLENSKSNLLFQAGKIHSSKDLKNLFGKKSSIPNMFYAKISFTHNLTIEEQKVLQFIYYSGNQTVLIFKWYCVLTNGIKIRAFHLGHPGLNSSKGKNIRL